MAAEPENVSSDMQQAAFPAENITHRRLSKKEKARICCQKCFAQQADICEQLQWSSGNTKGISFFYYCTLCCQAIVAARASRERNRGNGVKSRTP
jgi:late competence protein required for DNA uptake (superfamily II DNA/RNA helicase)